jgi:hypothetical protein
MNLPKRFWTRISLFAASLKGMDDPIGDYMFSLGKRVDELERRLKELETHLRSNPGDGRIQR